LVIDDVGVIPCGYPNPLLQPRMGILFLASYLKNKKGNYSGKKNRVPHSDETGSGV